MKHPELSRWPALTNFAERVEQTVRLNGREIHLPVADAVRLLTEIQGLLLQRVVRSTTTVVPASRVADENEDTALDGGSFR